MEILRIKVNNDTYAASESAKCSITVGELIDMLECEDMDAKVIIEFDNGYTYGYLSGERVCHHETIEDEEE